MTLTTESHIRHGDEARNRRRITEIAIDLLFALGPILGICFFGGD